MIQINNGYAEYYYLLSDGRVYNAEKDSYISSNSRHQYKLKTIDDKYINISLKKLYSIVYNKAYLDEFLAETGYKGEVVDDEYVFYGLAAHAMQPECGVNAIYHMFKFMNKYYPCDAASFITNYFDTTGKLLGVDIDDVHMHALTINLGICKYDGNKLVLGYNLRVPVDAHVEVIKAGFKNALANYSNLDFGQAGYSPRHFVSLESELVSKLINAYQTITNDYESKPFTIGGGTYARTMSNAVTYGPNFLHRPDICHQPDEHIYLEDFVMWIAIYAKAIYDLAK